MQPLSLPSRLFVASSYRAPGVSEEERFAACSLLFMLNPKDVGLRQFFEKTPIPADWEEVCTWRDRFELELSHHNSGRTAQAGQA